MLRRIWQLIVANRRHILGLICLLAVICIWVGSSNLMQFIFQDNSFSKPFFLTYFSTSLFTIYLAGFVCCKSWREQDFSGNVEWNSDTKDKLSPPDSPKLESSLPLVNSDEHTNPDTSESEHPRLSLLQVAKLSLMFCPIWFLANYTFNASLTLTSVSSNTIISTTSSFFTLLFGHLGGVEKITIKKIGAVVLTCGGVALVSLSDKSEGEHGFWGDLLALLGALFYGLYCSLMRIKIKDERQISMAQFFGFVGFFNMMLLWPFIILLHYTGVEVFEVPTLDVVLYLTINGLVGTVLSDLLWSFSIFLTSALVATLGLSLNAPVAMLVDLIRQKKTFYIGYLIGGALVLTGFLIANITCAWEEDCQRKTEESCKKRCKCCGKDNQSTEDTVTDEKNIDVVI